ncbi:MAG TPA: DMT family transporter [Solirubrobacteraceae bacterium]|jgi:drug/metabolite transporter (DMT)-like permease|nr:DMT family transporter [Solirubrobacteraceae bacterium]
MLAIALGLGSSLFWGLADFGGGLQSRRYPVVAVLFVSQAVGLAGIAVVVALSGDPAPPLGDLWPAAAGGIGGLIALAAFYRALAIGTMSIVAPISATGSAVPVIVGLATGERPSALQLVGILAAGAGVVLASREAPHEDEARARAGRASIGLALVAALGFGAFFVGMDRAADVDVLWAMLAARVADAALLVPVAIVLRPALHIPPRGLAVLAVIGILDLTANGLYAWGTTQGLLSVVAVLGSLYPLATVLLARAVLGERIRRVQEIGVVGALTGVVLIAAG